MRVDAGQILLCSPVSCLLQPVFHQVAILITESADTARANATGNHNHGGSSTGLFNDEMEKMDAVDATPANEEAVRVARNERLKRFQQQQLHHHQERHHLQQQGQESPSV